MFIYKVSFKFSTYSLKVKVYYDDPMFNTYSKKGEDYAEKKLRSVMVFVEEMFHERDTLKTVINIDAKDMEIERVKGANWESKMR